MYYFLLVTWVLIGFFSCVLLSQEGAVYGQVEDRDDPRLRDAGRQDMQPRI